ncbi:MAG TPA: RecX family transcriptional regulator [Vicinamibacterales bacterium]
MEVSNPAYIDGLKLLARRELSRAQVRQRLLRRHAADLVDEAIARLSEERAIDDSRVAEAIARTQTSVRGRGRQRVRMEIERAGIDKSTARRVVEEVFEGLDDDALLEAALSRLARRQRSGDMTDDRQRARLYRRLVAEGFDADRVLASLKRHKRDEDK